MSNQVARNSRSSYYVEDNHLYIDKSLTRWDASAQRLDNSLALIDDSGELTVPSITVGTSLCSPLLKADNITECTLDNGVLIENKYLVKQAGSDFIQLTGNTSNPNPTQDIDIQYHAKRDVDLALVSDIDDVATGDNPNIWLFRDGQSRLGKIGIENNLTGNFKISTAVGSGSAPDIVFETGGTYSIPSLIPGSLMTLPTISGSTEALKITRTQNVEIPNGTLTVGNTTTSDNSLLVVQSNRDATIYIEADVDNAVSESDNPRLIMSQDGASLDSALEFGLQSTDNSMVMRSCRDQYFYTNSSITDNGPGNPPTFTSGVLGLKITNDQDVEIPNGNLTVQDNVNSTKLLIAPSPTLASDISDVQIHKYCPGGTTCYDYMESLNSNTYTLRTTNSRQNLSLTGLSTSGNYDIINYNDGTVVGDIRFFPSGVTLQTGSNSTTLPILSGAGDPGLVIKGDTQNVEVQKNLLIGNTSDAEDRKLLVQSRQSSTLYLEADTDNVTESDNAFIVLSQDGGVTCFEQGLTDNNDYSFRLGDLSGNPRDYLFYTQSVITDNGIGNLPSFTTGDLSLTIKAGGGIQLPTSGGTPSTLSYYEEFTFTPTFTGAWSNTMTVRYVRIGKQVTVVLNQRTLPAISGSTLVSTNGIPTRFQPNTTLTMPCTVLNNSIYEIGSILFDETNGVITIGAGNNLNSFSSSGSCGLAHNQSFTWFIAD